MSFVRIQQSSVFEMAVLTAAIDVARERMSSDRGRLEQLLFVSECLLERLSDANGKANVGGSLHKIVNRARDTFRRRSI